MYIIDTHAHLMDMAFKEDFKDVWERTFENIHSIINIGCNFKDAKIAVELAHRHERSFGSVSLHPIDAKDYTEEGWENLKALANDEKVCAIGETGLDYHWKTSTKEEQQLVFVKHIELAKSINKPLIIHDREAHRDTCDILWGNKAEIVSGVFHAYSGSLELTKEILNHNFYISLGGVVTFKNAKTVKEVAKTIPLDRLLIETDSPYLTPEPFRGKRNEPSYVIYVAEEIARLRNISFERLIETTYENTCRLFKLKL